MYTRTLKQKLLLSFQMPHRLRTFINQNGNGAYKDHFVIKDDLVFIQQNGEDDNLKNYPSYTEALILGCKNNQEIWKWLKKSHRDFNSRFEKEFGVTLDEYTKKHLKKDD